MIYCGDAVEWANNYSGPLHHACFCDCPYHLSSIVKRFGGKDAVPAQEGTDGAFRRMSKGFMGMDWDSVDEDGNGVAMKPETWAAFAKVLYPGAFLLVFAGCLNDDAISMAMREGGLIKHHSLHWSFGSGFPKATQIPDERFNGHRYGRQSLKPAVETILLFQKPYVGRPLDCITGSGAGALNIDAARIGNGGQWQWEKPRGHGWNGYDDAGKGTGYSGASQGRWPSNLILQDEACEMIDRQSGNRPSGGKVTGRQSALTGESGIYGRYEAIENHPHYDSGGASRFFYRVQTAIDEADPVIYRAKSGNSERNAGLDNFARQNVAEWPQGGIQAGAERGASPRSNNHPTVKPLSLTRYLASLLLPPAEYAPRRLYVPFCGVSSEMIGADLAGWEEVSGVEQSADYCRIGEARRRFWSCNSGLFDALCEQPEEEATTAQGDLFG